MKVDSEKLDLAVDSILNTWLQGRRVLVVLGAGASVSAGIPNMTAVFRELSDSIAELHDRFENGIDYPTEGTGERPSIERTLKELCGWLAALAEQDAPRSVAAMALGTLQRSHLRITDQAGHRWLYQNLSSIWRAFSERFVKGEVAGTAPSATGESNLSAEMLQRIRKRLSIHPLANQIKSSQIRLPPSQKPNFPTPLSNRDPSYLHYCVSGWALESRSDLISLNFDGLTREALRRLSDPQQVVSVVVTEPKSLRNFFLGNPTTQGPIKRIVPVVKVWGDVFHAVCTNQRCPEFGGKVPIYELDYSKFNEGCPSCHASRQLQIFFTGYEEKERITDELMRELLKYIAPRIGCILTVGFSGLWDQRLVAFLATVCRDLDWENKHLGKRDQSRHASWICVDPVENPPLLQDLSAYGITPVHIPVTGDVFASLFEEIEPEKTQPDQQAVEKYNRHGCLEDGKWETLAKRDVNIFPKAYECFMDRDYLSDFKHLRQLGIKTKIALARSSSSGEKKNEVDHNRQKHSWGATALSALWFRTLAKGQNLNAKETERLATIVVFAAMHHDIGHLPFTHLAEEIFEEVHWSLENWSDVFRHDEPVLSNCVDIFREQIDKSTRDAAKLIECCPSEFHTWVEGAIQGRSGYAWIDAILNSPLDVDKLDYVFRDCDFLGQGIHISTKEDRYNWIENLFRHSRVLPSGVVALEGEAGEQARDFMEERRWLYKHQYHQPGYRALERLAAAVTLQWLLHRVPEDISLSPWHENASKKLKPIVADSSAIKGMTARSALWKELLAIEREQTTKGSGEPGLLLKLTNDLTQTPSRGLPPNARVIDWAKRCAEIFKLAFDDKQPRDHLTLLQFLTASAGMTCSESIYISFKDLKEAREIIRGLETMRPFRALFDIAIMPRMLSYPSRRRLRWAEDTILGECFAVAHRDPDRWGISTNHWIPMSESAFAERDKARWAKVMVVSPEPNDAEVAHALDRFRTLCKSKNIGVEDVDPDEIVG